MTDLIRLGQTAMGASRMRLNVAGHNISNAHTPGFSRQEAVQESRSSIARGAVNIGSGTRLTDVRRYYSDYLSTAQRSSTSLAAEANAYLAHISRIDALLADAPLSISGGMQQFFSAVQAASKNPAGMPERQAVLSQAQGLAQRFNALENQLAAQSAECNQQMREVSGEINRLSAQIAGLNQSISSTDTPSNDLLDARDEALRQLCGLTGINVLKQDNGSVNVLTTSGQPLVLGNQASQLEVVAGQSDPQQVEVHLLIGEERHNLTSQISGGELGGLLRQRSEALEPARRAIGRMALVMAQEVNRQLAGGLDLNSAAGAPLFSDINAPELALQRVIAHAANQGTAQPQLRIDDARLLGSSDIAVEFDGQQYQARRVDDGSVLNVTQNADGSLSFTDKDGREQGISLVMDGQPAKGDRFLLQPTAAAASNIQAVLKDPSALALAAPVRAQAAAANHGGAQISQPELSGALDAATLQSALPVSLSWDGQGFNLPEGASLTRLNADGSKAASGDFQPGQENHYELRLKDGSTMRFSIQGTPKAGDRFELAFNAGGLKDNRNALKLADLQNAALVGVDSSKPGSGASLAASHGELVLAIGSKTAQAQQDDEACTLILAQASNNRDSLSAVDIDEEGANLVRFTQHYSAAAQVIQVARTTFDTLLNSLH